MPPAGMTVDSVGHLRHLWEQGEKFHEYKKHYISKDDVMRLKIIGVTQICFVWQDKEMQTQNWVMQL